jgi:hypothetical protein
VQAQGAAVRAASPVPWPELLAEQRRINRLLRAVIYSGVGFLLGVLTTHLLIRAY